MTLRDHQKKAIKKLTRKASQIEVPKGLGKSVHFEPDTCECPTCEGDGCDDCQGTGRIFL